jgi:hypothetical protein
MSGLERHVDQHRSVTSQSRQAACRLLSFIQSEAIGAVYNLLQFVNANVATDPTNLTAIMDSHLFNMVDSGKV